MPTRILTRNREAGPQEAEITLAEAAALIPTPAPTLAAVLAIGADAGTKKITGVVDPTTDQGAATKKYVDTAVGAVPTPTLAAVLTAGAAAGSKAITGLLDPTGDQDADTKAARNAAIALATAGVPPVGVTKQPGSPYNILATDAYLLLGSPGTDTINFPPTTTGRRVVIICQGNGGASHLIFGSVSTAQTFQRSDNFAAVTQFWHVPPTGTPRGHYTLEFIASGTANLWYCSVMSRPVNDSDGTSGTGGFA